MTNPAAPSASRRQFLQGASLSAAAFSIVQPQSVRGTQANSAITVGLIGCGGRGTYDTGNIVADPRAKVVALCDLFDDRIEAAQSKLKLENPKTFTSFEKLLNDPSIDAVLIATPPFEHPRMLEAAVEAKKHIYCEKPMGVDLEGVHRVIKASRRADPTKTLAVGFQQRYGPVYLEAFRLLQNGDLGELATARAFWIGGDPFTIHQYDDPKVAKLRNWFAYRDLSGDIIVEQDCHNFDVLHWFLNARPISAVGIGGRKIRTNMDILDNLSLSFRFPHNINVNYEANQLTPPGFSHVGEEFTGTKGTVATSRKSMIHFIAAKQQTEMVSKRDITIDALEAFLTRIQNSQPENVGERSAISTMFALLGRAAIYSGKEVTWKGEFGDDV
jgi:myo-inositol 2-dehydrogenase / D-chiro-inositol 1-dehydrogenase